MTWQPYTEVEDRFGHVDAVLIRTSVLFGAEAQAEVVLRYYPWWEHPRYVESRNQGQVWGFREVEAGTREVAIRAVNPIAVSVESNTLITDADFSRTHPVLWDYDNWESIVLNGVVDIDQVVSRINRLEIPYVRTNLVRQLLQSPDSPPRALRLPALLAQYVTQEFEALAVPFLQTGSPVKSRELALFLMNGQDYIVAEGFEVLMPEFIHRDEWFASPDETG